LSVCAHVVCVVSELLTYGQFMSAQQFVTLLGAACLYIYTSRGISSLT